MGSNEDDICEGDESAEDGQEHQDYDEYDDEEERDYVPPRTVTPEDVAGISLLSSMGEVEDMVDGIDANIELSHAREIARIKGERLQNLEKAHRAPRCQHLRLNGMTCGSPAVSGDTYCHFHRQALAPTGLDFPLIEDGRSFQIAVMRLCQQIAKGTIEPANAKLLLQAFSMAGENIDSTTSWMGRRLKNE